MSRLVQAPGDSWSEGVDSWLEAPGGDADSRLGDRGAGGREEQEKRSRGLEGREDARARVVWPARRGGGGQGGSVLHSSALLAARVVPGFLDSPQGQLCTQSQLLDGYLPGAPLHSVANHSLWTDASSPTPLPTDWLPPPSSLPTDWLAKDVLVVSSYPPKECGIAVFASNLVKAMRQQHEEKGGGGGGGHVMAIADDTATHKYPQRCAL
jgi:hypothetical protein